jgi:hypothetical protein
MPKPDLSPIVADCLAAAKAAAEAQFVKDGSTDVGSCGGMMLLYRGNGRFAKALVAAGLGHAGDGGTSVLFSHGLPTQHAEVDIQGLRAFEAKAREHGFEPSKAWTYVD